MRLKRLTVSLNDWGATTGKYTGEVEFQNQYGEIKIVLDPMLSQEVLRLCADALVAQTKETAQMFTANILEGVKTPALTSNEVA